jgi:hypothetical protein
MLLLDKGVSVNLTDTEDSTQLNFSAGFGKSGSNKSIYRKISCFKQR